MIAVALLFCGSAIAQQPITKLTPEQAAQMQQRRDSLRLADSLSAIVAAADTLSSSVPIIDYSTTPKPYTIKKINVHGVRFLNTAILIASSGLAEGQTIYMPGNAISQAVSRLWLQRYFSDVNIAADIEGDSVTLDFYLQERTRVYRWNISGISRSTASTIIKDELKLKPGTVLSDYVIERNIDLLKRYYSERGRRNVEVVPLIENDTIMRNAVNVTFQVTRNPTIRIGQINFFGNENFTDRKLRRQLKKIHQVSWNFFNTFKLKEENYREAKENLLDFYHAQGYRNAVILKDSIYEISPTRIGIDFYLDEGPQYTIRNIRWIGNTRYSTELLNTILGIKKGDRYDKMVIDKRLGIGKETDPENPTQISSMYQNEGYLMSQIDPSEIVVGENEIDLDIKIFEGKQFTINEVDITGNLRVNDEVVRREVYTRPGELYNRALVMQTMRQLAQMQHFEPTALIPQIMPVSNESVNIGWALTENASDKFNISGGWGAGMFVGTIGIQLTNFDASKFFKKGAWRPYPHGANQQLAINAQTNGSYYSSIMASFTEPWLGGKRPNSLTVGAHYSMQSNAQYFMGFISASSFFHTMGITAGLGRRLLVPDQYFTLYNELGFTSYYLKDWQYRFLFSNGRSNIITLRTVLGRSTVNEPIYPSGGSEFSLTLTLTPPYSLFDGRNYKALEEADDPSRFKWIEYHKWQGKVTWYTPLSADRKLVLMTRAELGYLGHYNRYKQSPFEGFDVGGDGMSGYNIYGVDIISLRGYEDGTLTPSYGDGTYNYAKVYNRYTAELRYVLLRQAQTTIWIHGFLEGGNAWNSWEEFNPFNIKRSAGVGVRLFLPMIGMIGVDWGYGFDKAVGATSRHGGQVHFMIGTQF